MSQLRRDELPPSGRTIVACWGVMRMGVCGCKKDMHTPETRSSYDQPVPSRSRVATMVLLLVLLAFGLSVLVLIGVSWALEPEIGTDSGAFGLMAGLVSFPLWLTVCLVEYRSSLRSGRWESWWW